MLLFCFWLHRAFLALSGLFLVAASGAPLHCGVRASHCKVFSCRQAQALGAQAWVVAARGLSDCGTGSVAVAHRLRCCAPCRIFKNQGSNPCPLHWQVDSYPLHHQGSPAPVFCFYVLFFFWPQGMWDLRSPTCPLCIGKWSQSLDCQASPLWSQIFFLRVTLLYSYLFLAVLGLPCWVGFPLVAVIRSYFLATVLGRLIEG